jgi:hypothetical protein
MRELKRWDSEILWHEKFAEINDNVSRDIHKQTLDLGNGRYLVMIQRSLPKLSACFFQVIAKKLYGERVTVQLNVDKQT